MVAVSVSTALYINNTEELISRLERLTSPAGAALLAEAKELLLEFRRWQTHKPPDEIRVEKIRAIFGVQRKALDLLLDAEKPRLRAHRDRASLCGVAGEGVGARLIESSTA